MTFRTPSERCLQEILSRSTLELWTKINGDGSVEMTVRKGGRKKGKIRTFESIQEALSVLLEEAYEAGFNFDRGAVDNFPPPVDIPVDSSKKGPE